MEKRKFLLIPHYKVSKETHLNCYNNNNNDMINTFKAGKSTDSNLLIITYLVIFIRNATTPPGVYLTLGTPLGNTMFHHILLQSTLPSQGHNFPGL